jgi:DNA-binding beta-propeller fold protein YncE
MRAIGSTDPSGLAYVPQSKTLFLSDSEVEGSPFNRAKNLWALGTDGSLKQSFSLVNSFTTEPAGLAFDALTGSLFITDDDNCKVFRVDPANPAVKRGEFLTKPLGVIDPEDIAIDPSNGHVFITNGTGNSSNGGPLGRAILETNNTGTQIFSTIKLPTVIDDPEALAYDAREDVFYVGGGFSYKIWKVARSGAILSTIDILGGYRNPVSDTKVHVKDLELAPSSDPNDNPGKLSLYVADYGNSHVNDGRLFEINLGDLMLV